MTDEIIVRDLERVYGAGDTAVRALRGVSLEIGRGEVVALTGPSGSGKTTLLNCLLGLDAATSGTIDLFGSAITELSYERMVKWRLEHAAIVFQTAGLLPHLSAVENVDFVLRMRGIDRAERRVRVDDTFERLGLSRFADHRPAELSGGQRQRVAIARAMATQPQLMVADEPTGQLDTATTAEVLRELLQWSSEHGTTMVVATHDHDVEALASRKLTLVDGRIEP